MATRAGASGCSTRRRPAVHPRAWEAGINFFDTADMYSLGASEDVLGRALKELARRDEVVVATKVFNPMGDGAEPSAACRASTSWRRSTRRCKRLGMDYVDLYQIHRFDRDTPIEETIEALRRRGQRRQGALSRRLLDVGLAVHEDAGPADAPTACAASSRCRTTTTSSTARRSAR